jgi:AI-2 transport system substrate-binding protein
MAAAAGVWAAAAMGGDTRVVLIPKVTGNAFFESANAGAQDYAGRIGGFRVEYSGSPVASAANQARIIEGAIESGADAICLSSVDAFALDSVMLKAKKAGIATVTWDSDINPEARYVMVSQGTPEILGRMLVDMGVQALKNRGRNPETGEMRYAWHYSQMAVADQNSWQVEGEKYIREKFPAWINVATSNYYSDQNPAKSVEVGKTILRVHKEIDLIICNDSTALPGQLQAMRELGLDKNAVTVTGFASPNAIKDYCRDGLIDRWGLWDCGMQAALACYLGHYLAGGNSLRVGDKIEVPELGTVEVLPNEVLDPLAPLYDDSGVILLPERVVFTRDNMDAYDF